MIVIDDYSDVEIVLTVPPSETKSNHKNSGDNAASGSTNERQPRDKDSSLGISEEKKCDENEQEEDSKPAAKSQPLASKALDPSMGNTSSSPAVPLMVKKLYPYNPMTMMLMLMLKTTFPAKTAVPSHHPDLLTLPVGITREPAIARPKAGHLLVVNNTGHAAATPRLPLKGGPLPIGGKLIF